MCLCPLRLEEAIAEEDGYDLVVMGQPEGAGCYCAANSILTNFLEKLTANYPYTVMDNEAGMEHISRLTTRNVNVLLLVTDASPQRSPGRRQNSPPGKRVEYRRREKLPDHQPGKG